MADTAEWRARYWQEQADAANQEIERLRGLILIANNVSQAKDQEIERLRRLIAEPWRHMAYEQGRRDAAAALEPGND